MKVSRKLSNNDGVKNPPDQELIIRPKEILNPTNLIQNPSSPWTALKEPMKKHKGMKFMGFRFMSVWVFPMAILGIIMEFLFVGPIRNTIPFG